MTEFKRDTVEMQFVTAIYELVIQNYSQYSTVGMSVQSPCFKLLDRMWSVQIYPSGDSEAANGYISVYLYNEEVDSEVKASSTFILVNQKRETDSKRQLSTSFNVYNQKGKPNSDWGQRKFLKQRLLTDANSQFIVDDTVIFRVEIKISTKTVSPTVPKLGSGLFNSLNVMFEAGLGSDVEVIVANIVEKIPAHKCILMARSAVFKAMFTHNMSESNTNEIVIYDFSLEVVREMLHFMYTDKLQSEALDNTVYEGLLGAAIKYDVADLVNFCEEHFCSQISDDNVVSTFKIADACGSTELKAVCMAYIRKHATRLMSLPSFSSIIEYALATAPVDCSCVGEKRKAESELDYARQQK